MSELLNQIKWQFLVFRRNNLLGMILGITAFYMLVIFLLRDIGNIERFTTLLIFNEPSMLGFVFIGLAIILEKDQDVFSALFVTPINHHFYLISRVLLLSLISLVCALGMVFIAKGTAFNLVHFVIGVFSSCVLFSLVGIFVVSYTQDILHYMLRAIPIVIFMSLPLLNYFELTDYSFFKLFPVQGSLSLIENSYALTPNTTKLVFGYFSIAIWVPFLYTLVYRVFKSRLVNA